MIDAQHHPGLFRFTGCFVRTRNCYHNEEAASVAVLPIFRLRRPMHMPNKNIIAGKARIQDIELEAPNSSNTFRRLSTKHISRVSPLAIPPLPASFGGITMPDPQVLSNQLTIIFGIITTMITIASVVVAVTQCRRRCRDAASNCSVREDEEMQAVGRLEIITWEQLLRDRVAGPCRSGNPRMFAVTVWPMSVDRYHADPAAFCDPMRASARSTRPDNVTPSNGPFALMQHHNLPPPASRLNIISISTPIHSPLPRHILPPSNGILNARQNFPITNQLIPDPSQRRLATFLGGLEGVRGACRGLVAVRIQREAATRVPRQIVAVAKIVDKCGGALAFDRIEGVQVVGDGLFGLGNPGIA